MQPLMDRKKLLQTTVKENGRIAVSRYFEGTGTALFTLAKQQGLEGVVGKRKDSVYIQGKRTKDWKKIKNLLDDDFVVCGYIRKDNHMTSIVLGQYDKEGVLRYKSHVTLGVGGKPFQRILEQPRAIHPSFEAPPGHGNEDAVWLAPTLVCTVEFMDREDCLPLLESKYGTAFQDVKGLDASLRYTAIENDEVDVVDAFATDALLSKLGLTMLEDDLSFFPPYYAVNFVDAELLESDPELAEVLSRLDGAIDEATMAAMNAQVDVDGMSAQEVAQFVPGLLLRAKGEMRNGANA